MDPHDVLGVRPGAGPEEIARAYRELAKRFHPDRRPDDVSAALMMREINAAHAALAGRNGAGPPPEAPPPPRAAPRRARAGHWLDPAVRRALGPELLAVLEDGEAVLVVTEAATSDAFRVRLAVSDRRLLWLRDDAPTDRVRTLRFARVEAIEGRLRGRRRPTGHLRVTPRHGRRLTFAELEPDALRSVLLASRRRVPAR